MSQQTPGGDLRRGAGELACPLKDLQAGIGELGAPEPVCVEPLFPLFAAGLLQGLRRWEAEHEAPCRCTSPVLEGFQCSRIVFAQGTLKLVDERGTLLDQCALVAAEQPQLFNERVFGRKPSPAVAVHTQRIGQAPCVELIILGPTGSLALTISLGALGMNWIDRQAKSQQLLHSRTLAGFDSHRQRAKGGKLRPALSPTFAGMGEAEAGDDGAASIHHDHVVMIAGPIEASEVSMILPVIHGIWQGCWRTHRPDPAASRADTRALAGHCSLRLLRRSRRRGR